jgi:hypothetical protein
MTNRSSKSSKLTGRGGKPAIGKLGLDTTDAVVADDGVSSDFAGSPDDRISSGLAGSPDDRR